MCSELPQVHLEHNSKHALAGALALAILVFMLIPITQNSNNQADVLEYREIVLVQPPAPIPPPKAAKQQPEKKPPKPSFEKQFESLNLNQIEISLNPGISSALAKGIADDGFETEIDAIGEIQRMFTFADLPQAPSIINRPRIQFPQELIERGVVEGRIVALIEIDERGRATIVEIRSSTHPQLVKTARDVIRQAQFTQPLINGVAQKVRGEWPLLLRAPN